MSRTDRRASIVARPSSGWKLGAGSWKLGAGSWQLKAKRGTLIAVLCISTIGGGACRQDMHDQPKYTPYKAAEFFTDQRSARPPIEGTIAQGQLFEDELLYSGKQDGQPATVFPFPIDEPVMQRGRERYDIFCSPCHGLSGDGSGMVVRRGYRRPPSFHVDRLRQVPPGHVFDVVTNGFGAMPDYAAQIPVRDRWAIAAYLRALQLSQFATVVELSPAAQGALK